MDGGVADGEKGRQLVHALAPVVAQYGLGPAAVAQVFGVVAARLERRHFVGSQEKGDKHVTKITPPPFYALTFARLLNPSCGVVRAKKACSAKQE